MIWLAMDGEIGTVAGDMRLLNPRCLAPLLAIYAFSLQAAEQRPNLLLFVVDDMGWMDSSVYGSRYYETPHMERLAASGMIFWNAYSAHPLCSPTRASLITGQYPARHGITTAAGHTPPDPADAPRYPEKVSPNSRLIQPRTNRFLDPAIITLAERLREAGYRTGHIGKWHLGLRPEHWPEAQGFETVFHGAPDPGPPSYHSPYGFKAGTVTDGAEGEYITDRITDEAVKFIEAHQGESWYLNLWQYGVHGPWGHKEAYTAAFKDKTDPRGAQRNPIMASLLKSVDESLGRVLDTLDRLKIADRTLVILTSDNGGNVHSNIETDRKTADLKPGHPRWPMVESWRKWAGFEPPTNNAPLREGKGSLYEGGVRVPLIVRWPGRIAPASDTLAVAASIDVFPTVLDAFGLERPPGQPVDGVSLLPVLTGKAADAGREALFNFFPHGGPGRPPGVTVRRGDWKLIRWFETGPEQPALLELYHLRDDLGESTNVAQWHPDEVAALNGLIDGFLTDTGAAVPKPNPAWRGEVDPAKAKAAPADPLLGWIPKGGTASRQDDGLRVAIEPGRRNGFIATTRLQGLKAEGPVRIVLTLGEHAAGRAEFQWRAVGQETFPETGQRVGLDLTGEPGAIEVALPVMGKLAHLRLFLPGSATVQNVRILPADESVEAALLSWDFGSKDR